jgi:Fic family protein
MAMASPQIWLMLGECQSKCDHIARVPLRPKTAEELLRVYLAKGVLATTAIEGNTLSEEQVVRHLEGKLELPPSRQYLADEINNILQACNRILKSVSQSKPLVLTPDSIKDLNLTVLQGLTLNDGVIPGEIRKHSVGVARYRGAPAEDCEYLLARLCDWLNSETFEPKQGNEIICAVLKAILAHLYLAWIHPFGDGNGRTARMIEFQILISSGVPSPAAHLLSNHYNQTRTEYYRQLDSASKSGGDVLPFVNYAVTGFLDQLRDQLDVVWAQQWDVAWRNYVHEAFKDQGSKADIRRRRLALDLSLKEDPVPLSKLPEVSVRLAAAYAKKTKKTLTRDVGTLIKMNLLKRQKAGYVANKELILGFLPARAQ